MILGPTDGREFVRHIDFQWDEAPHRLDPHLSYVLDRLAFVVRIAMSRHISQKRLAFFNSVKVYGYSDIPNRVNLGHGELAIAHYPRSIGEAPGNFTANENGTTLEMEAIVVVMAMVGFPSAEIGTIAIKGSDVPEALRRVYNANSRLLRENGQPLLQGEIGVGRFDWGTLQIGGGPAGWQAELRIPLEYEMRNWIYG